MGAEVPRVNEQAIVIEILFDVSSISNNSVSYYILANCRFVWAKLKGSAVHWPVRVDHKTGEHTLKVFVNADDAK